MAALHCLSATGILSVELCVDVCSSVKAMQSEHPRTVSRNLRIHTNLRAGHHAKPDTRRFAGIFPLENPEGIFVGCGDATHEQHSSGFGDSGPLRWEFADKSTLDAQVASVASGDEISPLSATQRIVARYCAIHGSDHASESATTEIKEKQLPQVPDDQRSMHTHTAPTDTQSTMDMMWRPKPKVHMSRTDRRALLQAQSQAIAMMHNAGLKPTNKIQCRRRGCANILRDVEALKYHLHIHNIADMAPGCNDTSPSAARKPSLVECRTSNSKASKRSHSRSQSSLGIHHSCSAIYSPPRKLSAGCLLPSLFSPRDSTLEVPSLATVATALAFEPSSSKSIDPRSVYNNNETTSTHTSVSSRGRIMREESKFISVGTERNPSVAMLLSPHSLPGTQGRLALTSRTNSPMPPELDPVTDGENDDRAFIENENAHSVGKKLVKSQSPMRALSPMRAMSPIRNGIRRILSIGCPVDFTDK